VADAADVSILAYMTDWCPDCRDAHDVLRRSGLSFQMVNVETAPNAERDMIQLAEGIRKVPTILIEAGPHRKVLVEPGVEDLRAALREAKLAATQQSDRRK